MIHLPLPPKFYGRRVGRQPLSCRTYVEQAIRPWSLSLPQLSAVTHLQELFEKPCRAFWMEIGFGYGEHTVTLLERYRDVGMIGVEPFLSGVSSLLRHVEQASLIPHFEGRLRLIAEDVRPFLPGFPSQQLERLYVLFSDPWPKKRHHKRRLVNASFLHTCNLLLQGGGELYLAHDHVGYMGEMLELLGAQNALTWKSGLRFLSDTPWCPWPEDWPLTRYGEKALSQGRPLAFSVWEKARGA